MQYSNICKGRKQCTGIVVCSLHVMHRYEKQNLICFVNFLFCFFDKKFVFTCSLSFSFTSGPDRRGGVTRPLHLGKPSR